MTTEVTQPMTTERASEIIGNCYYNGLYHVGVIEDRPNHMDYTIDEMLEARKIVKRVTDERLNSKDPGLKTVQMNVADRGLAAMYTAMSFEGGTPDEPNVVGYANGNYVLVIRETSIKG